MKKYLALFLTFVILSSAALIGAGMHAAAPADAVVYTEKTVFGDKSQIDGIELFLELHCAEHLFWDCTLTLGEEIRTDTKFSYINDYDPPVSETNAGFDLGFGLNSFGASGSGDLLDDRDFFGQYDMIADVASRAPAGEEYTETVRIADYYDYYPIAVDIHVEDLWFNTSHTMDFSDRKYGEQIKKLQDVLSDMFVIPTAEHDLREIRIKKRADGTVSEVHSSSVEGSPNVYLNTYSAFTDDAVYFTVLPMTHEGNADFINLNEIRGGWGIYVLPYTITDYETPYYADAKTMVQLNTDALSCVYPLDTGVTIEDFVLSDDAKTFFLTTRRPGITADEVILTVIDRETMTEVQSETIFTCGTEDALMAQTYENDFILYKIAYRKFAVIEKKDGRWQTAFMTEDDSISEYWSNQTYVSSHYTHTAAYDGERLVLAGYSNERGGNGWDRATSTLAAVYLSVYSEKGHLYTGKFTSSLDTGTYLEYNNTCRPKDGSSPALRLP